MVDQTKLNQRNGSPTEPTDSLRSDVGGLAREIITLAELQSQLFLAEARELGQRSLVPSLFMVVGVLLGIACFPIALIAAALSLVQFANFSLAVAFLGALSVGMLGSLMLTMIGWLQVRKHACLLKRSREELMHNYRWIKSAFNASKEKTR